MEPGLDARTLSRNHLPQICRFAASAFLRACFIFRLKTYSSSSVLVLRSEVRSAAS